MDRAREELLIRTFFAKERQERWLQRVRKPHLRPAALDELNHIAGLDDRFTIEADSLAAAREQLRKLGAAPTCYVMSDIRTIDGRVMDLDEALTAAETGPWGALLDCLPGRLGYYSGEHAERRLVLWRRTP